MVLNYNRRCVMRRVGWLTMALVGLVGVPGMWAQDPAAPAPVPANDPMRDIEIRHKQLDVEQREADMEFQKEMRQLELHQKKMELKGQGGAPKGGPGPMGPNAPGMGPCGPGMGPCGSGPCAPAMGPGGKGPCGPGMGPCGPPSAPKGPLGRRHHGHAACALGVMAFCGIIHILLAVWVYQDIRKRNSGSGIWIVLALLTGVVGTLLYLLARIGDNKTP